MQTSYMEAPFERVRLVPEDSQTSLPKDMSSLVSFFAVIQRGSLSSFGGFVSSPSSKEPLSNFVVSVVVACNHLVSLSLQRKGVKNAVLLSPTAGYKLFGRFPPKGKINNLLSSLCSARERKRLILAAAKQLLMLGVGFTCSHL